MTAAYVPLKQLVAINARTLPENTDPQREIRYVEISLVGQGELVAEPQLIMFGDAPSRARRLVSAGDTIVSTVRTYLRAVWTVPRDEQHLVVSTGFAVLTPRGIDPRYLSWWTLGNVFIDEVVARSVGVSYPAINPGDLGLLPVRIVDRHQQRAIADFLDAETARIDALIAKKRRMIDILDERKASIMASAVSGHLTQLGPFEASTLAWMNDRPAHWRDVLLRLVTTTGSGHTPSRDRPDWWQYCTVPWITTGEVAALRSDEVEWIRETREKISELGLANSAAVLHPAGTVVLCRTASAGYSGIMAIPMATSQDFATWTCGPLLRPRFLLYCLRAMRSDLLGRLALGSTHKTIYMPDIHGLRIPLPSLHEQDEIVGIIEKQLQALFAVRHRINTQISLIREHRQALITAAVTGELEIPGVAA